MSRHGGSRVGRGLPLFQIEVLDFSQQKRGYDSYDSVLVRDHYGNLKKTVDTLPEVPCRTIVERFKDYAAALRYGKRFGTVKECHKVDVSPYLKNIDHLNLKQEPMTIEVEREEFILNESLEVTRARQTTRAKIDVDTG